MTEQLPGVCHAEKPTQASPVCGGEADSPRSPELLLYSSPKELQTWATLKLQVAMLDQQIHLEKVLPGQEVVVYLGSWEPVRDLTEAGAYPHPHAQGQSQEKKHVG